MRPTIFITEVGEVEQYVVEGAVDPMLNQLRLNAPRGVDAVKDSDKLLLFYFSKNMRYTIWVFLI